MHKVMIKFITESVVLFLFFDRASESGILTTHTLYDEIVYKRLRFLPLNFLHDQKRYDHRVRDFVIGIQPRRDHGKLLLLMTEATDLHDSLAPRYNLYVCKCRIYSRQPINACTSVSSDNRISLLLRGFSLI